MEEATANNEIVVGAIDLGSNTFRLLVARIEVNGIFVLHKRNVTVQLGHSLSATDGLSADTINNGLAVLAEFKEELDRYRVNCYRCCGTEALRKAVNAEVFIAEAAKNLSIKVEVLSGREEALLSCRGVLSSMTGNTFSLTLEWQQVF